MPSSLPRTGSAALHARLSRGRPRPVVVAVVLSLVLHAMGAAGLAILPRPEPVADRVLQVEFVSRGSEPGDKEVSPPEPAVADAAAAVSPSPRPPAPVAQPTDPAPTAPAPTLPEVRFPALQKAAQAPAPQTEPITPQPSFADWQQARMAHVLPAHIPDGGGNPDGTASIDSEGVDRCEPAPGREIDRLYLLYDSSGSMSPQLRAQALSCAHQYAEAAIERGAVVVVGNFARSTSFQPATRDMTDVAFALRAENDHRATVLPSRELNPFFEEARHARSDLVILSDGWIPNHREVRSWYRYFLDMSPENRGYLYTLGQPGHPEVVASLREIGFEIYIYRIL